MQTQNNAASYAEVNFGAISEAVEQFKCNAVTWVVSVIITGTIFGLISLIIFFSLPDPQPTPLPGTPGIPPVTPSSSFNLSLLLGLLLISAVIHSLLGAGMFRMATKQMHGQVITISDLFDFGDVAIQAIIAGILVGLMIYVGIILCILPGLVLAGLLMFTFPLIVDKKMSATKTIAVSFNALKSQWLMATIFVIFDFVLYVIGAMFCGVGTFISAPIALLSIAVLYRNFLMGSNSPPRISRKFEPAIPPGS